MAIFTAFVLAAFVSYAGAWYMGMYDGNFALLLFTATVVTGVYWLAERFYFLPQRLSQAQALEDEALARRWASKKPMAIPPPPASVCSCSLGGWIGRLACFR